MAVNDIRIGEEASATKGWYQAHQFLILRRISQLSILGLFLLGPWFGVWIVRGNLASSLTVDVLPLTDPYVFLQTIAAGAAIAQTALIGALLVLVFYWLVGGRVYCSWVCPVNMITDAASWLRYQLGIKVGASGLSIKLRYWILAGSFLIAAISGSLLWELVNPVSALHRSIIFGFSMSAALMVLALFLFDLFIAKHGWCGHVCPVGAFYSVVGKLSVVRVAAPYRDRCDDCLECFLVCPESQVIKPALKPENPTDSTIISNSLCTNCGRCIDVCAENVFEYSARLPVFIPKLSSTKQETTS